MPFALIVNPSLPVSSLKEFIACKIEAGGTIVWLRRERKPATLGAEMLKTAAGLDIKHVSYRGSVPAMRTSSQATFS